MITVREIWGFIVWQWSRYDRWQKAYIFGGAMFGAGLVSDGPWSYLFFVVPTSIVVGILLKWMVWDTLIANWRSYQKEKAEFLSVIKNSDSTR